MGVRDIVITIIVFGALPFVFKRPYFGILLWSWLGYMNPHRLTWGFAYNMPYAQATAAVTLLALFMSSDKTKASRVPVNGLTIAWAAFLIWMSITTVFAFFPDHATGQLGKIFKIQLVTLLTMLMINDRTKLEHLLWVICLSIAFFTVKGGIFTIQTGGGYRVWGPPGSFIEDNNSLAVASVMLIPLMLYLRSTLTKVWARHAMLAAVVLTAVSAAGSYSRSALVAGACVSIFLIWKSPRRSTMFAGLIIALPLVLTFMPDAWHDRMATIANPTRESSSNNRIESWATAINVANARLTGGGFDLWSNAVYRAYGPPWIDKRAGKRNGHSIYFNTLAEHGWIGLALFVLIFFLAWRQASYVIRRSTEADDLRWAGNFARMLQVSLIAYGSGGATLTLAYFDLPWHLAAISIVLRRLVDERLPAKKSLFARPQPAVQTNQGIPHHPGAKASRRTG